MFPVLVSHPEMPSHDIDLTKLSCSPGPELNLHTKTIVYQHGWNAWDIFQDKLVMPDDRASNHELFILRRPLMVLWLCIPRIVHHFFEVAEGRPHEQQRLEKAMSCNLIL